MPVRAQAKQFPAVFGTALKDAVYRRQAAQLGAKSSRFRHKTSGLITRLFCAECLPPRKGGRPRLLLWGTPNWPYRNGRFLRPERIFMKHNSGFTLIEVLVVVLIIGILSSVALPQYQKAVMRSRFAQMNITNNAIVKAQQVYYDTFNKYATTMDELDISIQNTPNVECYANDGANLSLCFLFSNGNQVAALQSFLYNDDAICCTYADSNYVGDSLCQTEMNNKSWYNGCGSTPCHCYHKQ